MNDELEKRLQQISDQAREAYQLSKYAAKGYVEMQADLRIMRELYQQLNERSHTFNTRLIYLEQSMAELIHRNSEQYAQIADKIQRQTRWIAGLLISIAALIITAISIYQ